MAVRPGKPPGVPTVLWSLGDAFLPPDVRRTLDKTIVNLGSPINGWTFVHVMSGVASTTVGLTLMQSNMIHVAWEAFQISIGMTDLSNTSEWFDIFWDTTAFYIGALAVQ